MKLAHSGVLINLTKNVVQSTRRLPLAAISLNRNHCASVSNQRYYSSAPGKQNLLRFPAFPLEETIDRFIKTCEPLLTVEELNDTKKAAEEFLCNDGKKLQELLKKEAEKDDNWLASRWLHVAYLQYRDPVTVFSSPGMSFPPQIFRTGEDYLNYTAKAIYALVKYKDMVDRNEIPIVKMGKNELDNSQFGKVFGTNRRPVINEDVLEYHTDSKHITVLFRNHFYKVPVYNRDGQPLSFEVLVEFLKQITKSESTDGIDFGVLTTAHRDSWAEAYCELTKIGNNEASIREIESSLFTVSLDRKVPIESGKALDVLCGQLIHGGGPDENSGNRWMDKTIQLVVNPNGLSGFTYEHSPAEGQPIALMTDFVSDNLKNEEFFCDGADNNYELPAKLVLESNATVKKHIEAARYNVNRLATTLQMRLLHYQGFGKGFLKMQKLSPDSFIQIALQYAFYKMHKVPGATYETAHLRIYAGGRTETIRSCSSDAIAFAKAMLEDCSDVEKNAELLRKAVNGHRSYTTLALQGRGVDRHLLGLKLMALENDLPIPEFYKSVGYVKSQHFRLSTSQVASKYASFMCYGPLTEDGYSCCYNPRENDMLLAIGSWTTNRETNSGIFANTLTECFEDMHNLLSCVGPPPAAKL